MPKNLVRQYYILKIPGRFVRRLNFDITRYYLSPCFCFSFRISNHPNQRYSLRYILFGFFHGVFIFAVKLRDNTGNDFFWITAFGRNKFAIRHKTICQEKRIPIMRTVKISHCSGEVLEVSVKQIMTHVLNSITSI